MKILTAYISLLAACSAHARLGETPDQCAKRYGQISERTTLENRYSVTYAKGVLITKCRFDDGKCVGILFQFVGGVPGSRAFTKNEIQTILQANGTDWSEDAANTGKFKTKDGTRLASAILSTILVLEASEQEKLKQMASPEAVAEDLKSF